MIEYKRTKKGHFYKICKTTGKKTRISKDKFADKKQPTKKATKKTNKKKTEKVKKWWE